MMLGGNGWVRGAVLVLYRSWDMSFACLAISDMALRGHAYMEGVFPSGICEVLS